MGYHFKSHCFMHYLFIVFYGLLQEVGSQHSQACKIATGRNDFREYGNSCFWWSNSEDFQTWKNSQDICKAFGGNLATVTEQRIFSYLQSNAFLLNNNYWIGLYIDVTDLVNSANYQQRMRANWKWLDGTTYDYGSAVGWNTMEPGANKTVVVLREGKWVAVEATESVKNPFICETKLSHITKAATTLPSTRIMPPTRITTPPVILPTSTPFIFIKTTAALVPPSLQVSQPDPQQQPFPPSANDPAISPQDSSACESVTKRTDFKRFNDSCFWVSSANDTRIRSDADKTCSNFGGNLATVARQDTVTFLRTNWNFESYYGIWIGLSINLGSIINGNDHLRRRQAAWVWQDGTPYDPQGKPGWAFQEPLSNTSLGLLFRFQWAALDATYQTRLPYICETKLQPLRESPTFPPDTGKTSSNPQSKPPERQIPTSPTEVPSTTSKTTAGSYAAETSSTTKRPDEITTTSQTTASSTTGTSITSSLTSTVTYSKTMPSFSSTTISSTYTITSITEATDLDRTESAASTNTTETSSTNRRSTNKISDNVKLAALGLLIIPIILIAVLIAVCLKRKGEKENNKQKELYHDLNDLEPPKPTDDDTYYLPINQVDYPTGSHGTLGVTPASVDSQYDNRGHDIAPIYTNQVAATSPIYSNQHSIDRNSVPQGSSINQEYMNFQAMNKYGLNELQI